MQRLRYRLRSSTIVISRRANSPRLKFVKSYMPGSTAKSSETSRRDLRLPISPVLYSTGVFFARELSGNHRRISPATGCSLVGFLSPIIWLLDFGVFFWAQFFFFRILLVKYDSVSLAREVEPLEAKLRRILKLNTISSTYIKIAPVNIYIIEKNY